ncbi:MAG: 30S ribosomal protein S4 [archaeon]
MGDPKKSRKKFDRPKKLWDKKRIEEEKNLVNTYGLKNLKELWLFKTILRNKKQNARKLLAGLASESETTQRKQELLSSLEKIGLLENAGLDDALTLSTEELLERRLQTIVWRENLANTVKQARQIIVHGFIAVNDKKLTSPSYLVKKNDKIGYFGNKKIILDEKKESKTIDKKEEPKESLKQKFEEVKGEAKEVNAVKPVEKGKEAVKEKKEAIEVKTNG